MNAMSVRIAGCVQPITSPLFTPVPRREQAIDELLVGVPRSVVEKSLNFRWSGWKAGKIQ
jgi:hypothetical protein